MKKTWLPIAAAVFVVAIAVLTGVYLANRPQPSPSPSPNPSASPSPTGSATPTVSAQPTPTPPAWQSAAYEYKAPAGTTAGTLTAIRVASHPEGRYDRIAFDFNGAMPGYKINKVIQVVRDGSGQTVSMPGQTYLQIVFNPAAAHTEQGQSSLSSPPTSPVTVSYPQLTSYVLNGDFEGYVSLALGLKASATFRTTAYASGNHWTGYVDVSW